MNIILFGLGEIASLAHFYFENDSDYKVCGFVVDDEYQTATLFRNLPVVKKSECIHVFPPSEFKAHVALSYSKLNKTRELKYFEMKSMGYEMVSYVCSKSVLWSDLDIGDNCFILENQTIQPTVKIGNNVMIWSSNHLGHGCTIKDHSYLSSGIVISGHTTIGSRTFVGVNSSFKDFINIGNDCFITMGSVVTKNISDNSTVIGSDIFEFDSEVNKKLKLKYFGI
jgi:sugar O-acyltransferase (sialic acid O-acetyltransferase NeuD family)